MNEYQTTQQPPLFKVLVIGEICKDIYYYGICNRLSPEAPVPILDFIEGRTSYGMASNVAKNVQVFGIDVELITNSVEDIAKHRFIDMKTHQQILRMDETRKIKPSRYIPQYKPDALIISDYDKGYLTDSYLIKLVDKMNSMNVPIFVDSKRKDLTPFNNCIIKLNEEEYNSVLQFPNGNHEVIVTIGKNGAIWGNGNHYPAPDIDAFDVTGAGDVFIASLAALYLSNNNLGEIIPKAVELASISVQHIGTYILTPKDIASV